MQTTFAASEVIALLKEAMNQAGAPPAPDRPSGQHHGATSNREPPLAVTLRLRLGLRRAESRALAMLMERDHATKEELHAAMSPDSWATALNSRTVAVTLCGMRKKLEPHGVEIVNVYGLGFALAKGARDKLRLIAGHSAIGAATASDREKDVAEENGPLADDLPNEPHLIATKNVNSSF